MSQLKILHIGKYFAPFHGGIENFMHDLMLEQHNQGQKVFAAVHHHELGKSYCEDSDDGMTVYRIPIITKKVFVPIAPSFLTHLKQIVKKLKPDVIHLHMPNVAGFVLLFSRVFQQYPWVVHWHSDVLGAVPDWRVRILYPVYKVFENQILKRCSKVIATSPVYLNTSIPLQPYLDKCQVVPLGLTDNETTSGVNQIESDTWKLLCIGRLTYYKGHKFLLEAMSELQPENLTLDIVGTGELKDSLLEYTDALGLADKVTFHANLNNQELSELLSSSSMVCLPSIERTEAFGLVLLEAMRASKPCLVTDVKGSGMNWVVRHWETGIVVKASDSFSLRKGIQESIENKSQFAAFGKNGRQRFVKHFDIKQIANKIIALYRNVIASP